MTPPGWTNWRLPFSGVPTGLVAEALLRWLGKRSPTQGEGLPAEVRDHFTALCQQEEPAFQPGRIVLASRLNFLFWLDEEWTTRRLLPFFDWTGQAAEARGAWQGFLSASKLSRPPIERLKAQFLATAHHYHELDCWGESYDYLLTWVSLEAREAFPEGDLAEATKTIPTKARARMARMLVRFLQSAGDRRAEYFRNRVLPYLKSSIWPKSEADFTPTIRERLSRLFVAAGEAFPEALAEFKDWLEPLAYSGTVIYALGKSGLCVQFPREALEFLARVVDEQQHFPDNALKSCLEQIAQKAPNLARDPRYLRLKRLAPGA